MFFSKKETQHSPNQQHFESTQKFLEIDQIKDDLIVLKDGSLRAVLLVSSLNMELRSDEERNSIIYAYQSALNSLEFPLQLLVQSRKLDLTSYISTLEASARSQTIPLLQEQTNEYISFLKDILTNVNVMDKRFFVIIPYYPNIVEQKSKGLISFLGMKKEGQTKEGKQENYLTYKQQLERRVEITSSLLSSIGLNASLLPTKALIELFYACYNPETAGHEYIKTLDSLGAKYISTREHLGEEAQS